jgi:hypothetical protein
MYVKLTNKARKDYYSTPRRLDAFLAPDQEIMDNHSFVSFVGQWLGFESGENLGFINSIKEHTATVAYLDPVSQEERIGYYLLEDLEEK